MSKFIPHAAALAAIVLFGPSGVSAESPRSQPAQAVRDQGTMTFSALEQQAIGLGVRPVELKIGRRTAAIKGRDRHRRQVELMLDPSNGAVLAREFEN
jgi:hypothetical protein